MEFKDYYDVLELQRDAGFPEIRSAYRTLSKKYHPDMNEGDDKSKDRFIEIQEAYKILSSKFVKIKPVFKFDNIPLTNNGEKYTSSQAQAKEPNHTNTFIPNKSQNLVAGIWIVVIAIAVFIVAFDHFQSEAYSQSSALPVADTQFFKHVSEAEADKEYLSKSSTSFNAEAGQAFFEKADSGIFPLKQNEISKSSNSGITGEIKVAPRKYATIEDYLAVKSHDELVSIFGRGRVKKSVYTSSEGVANKCSVLQSGENGKLYFVWNNQKEYSDVRYIKSELINTPLSSAERNERLYSRQRIYLGMTLRELQELNGGRVYFYGWGWANGGILAANKTGTINFENLTIKLSCVNCSPKYSSAGKFSSAEAISDNQSIYVYSITVAG